MKFSATKFLKCDPANFSHLVSVVNIFSKCWCASEDCSWRAATGSVGGPWVRTMNVCGQLGVQGLFWHLFWMPLLVNKWVHFRFFFRGVQKNRGVSRPPSATSFSFYTAVDTRRLKFQYTLLNNVALSQERPPKLIWRQSVHLFRRSHFSASQNPLRWTQVSVSTVQALHQRFLYFVYSILISSLWIYVFTKVHLLTYYTILKNLGLKISLVQLTFFRRVIGEICYLFR